MSLSLSKFVPQYLLSDTVEDVFCILDPNHLSQAQEAK